MARDSTRRLASIDIIRGGVMVLMAIDHVRVYSGLPAGGPTPGIFFTRAKYPASLAFLLMTLGPTILLIPWLETARGALARWLTAFGSATCEDAPWTPRRVIAALRCDRSACTLP